MDEVVLSFHLDRGAEDQPRLVSAGFNCNGEQ